MNEKNDNNIYDSLYIQYDKLQKKIDKLSDDNYSLDSAITKIKNNDEEKDKKFNEISEKNENFEKNSKKFENDLIDLNKKISDLEEKQNRYQLNNKKEEQINRLNQEIEKLKERLDKEEQEKSKSFFDFKNNDIMKYWYILIIALVIIFCFIKLCSRNDSSNSSGHMKLPQQYSGYGGFSNNLM